MIHRDEYLRYRADEEAHKNTNCAVQTADSRADDYTRSYQITNFFFSALIFSFSLISHFRILTTLEFFDEKSIVNIFYNSFLLLFSMCVLFLRSFKIRKHDMDRQYHDILEAHENNTV